ncbi:MAG: hypothetical protein RIM84_02075 [Alphaproteobacteria bacterium]
MALYIAYVGLGAATEVKLDLPDPYFELRHDLYLIDTTLTRSRLYHQIKHLLPPDTPLLVAPLADTPKFKGMGAGALNWVRDLA